MTLRALLDSTSFWAAVLGFSVVLMAAGIGAVIISSDRASLDVGIVLGGIGSGGLVAGLAHLEGVVKRRGRT